MGFNGCKIVLFWVDKRAQNWFQTQFSNQMSPDFDSEDGDHATAIAAAAFAIYTNDESREDYNQKISRQGPNFPSRVNTRKEDPIRFPEPGRVSRRPSSNSTKGRQGKRHILILPEILKS